MMLRTRRFVGGRKPDFWKIVFSRLSKGLSLNSSDSHAGIKNGNDKANGRLIING
jgi:hypothetical protein